MTKRLGKEPSGETPEAKNVRKRVRKTIENPPIQKADQNALNTDPKTLVSEEKTREPVEQTYEQMSAEDQATDDLIKLKGPTEEKSDKKKKKNVGNVKDSFDDPDYGEPEKGKFEIKEGDIIDYLFKEVFLASCNWVGDTAGGYIGLGAYRTGSWLYHNPGKMVADDTKAGGKALWEKGKSIFSSSKTSDGEKNSTPDNETGRFATQILNLHEKQLKINPILANAENLDKIIEAIGRGKADEIEELPENLKKILKKMPPELLSQAANDPERITAIVTARVNEYMAVNTFATNYATATLLDAKSKDQNYGKENAEALYEMQLLEGQKLFLVNLTKPETERLDPIKMCEMALKARTQSSQNIVKDGKYNEVGKKPKTNSELTNLQQMLGKIPADAKVLGLDEIAQEQQKADKKNQEELKNANQGVDAAQAEKDEHTRNSRGKKDKIKEIKAGKPRQTGTRIVNANSNSKKQGPTR